MKDKFISFCSVEQGLQLSRLITVINAYPFYRSTGSSSGFPETWFPFRFFEQYLGTMEKYVMPFNDPLESAAFEKYLRNPSDHESEAIVLGLMERHFFSKIFIESNPADNETTSDFEAISTKIDFPSQEFLQFKLSKQDVLVLRRLGSFETLYISKCLGGGFWEQRGEELNDFFSYIEERANQLLPKRFDRNTINQILIFLSNIESFGERQKIEKILSTEQNSSECSYKSTFSYALKINRFLHRLGGSTLDERDINPVSFFSSYHQEVDDDDDSEENDYWGQSAPSKGPLP